MPLVSVLMPVYNGQRYICEAIDSILNQTFSDFELVIVDDGSTDNSISIINSYTDKRIRLYQNAENKGLGYTRNKCIEYARGEFLAKLDCDDISLPTRLEEQVSFLNSQPDFGIVGSWVQFIDEKGGFLTNLIKYTATAEEIPSILFFHNYFTQSAVMMRKSALPLIWYREEFPPAEDYDLWVRIAQSYKVWNLPKVLTYYRIHNTNVSIIKADNMKRAEASILRWQLQNFHISPTEEEFDIYFSISKYKFNESLAYLYCVQICLNKLKLANDKIKQFDKFIFDERLSKIMNLALRFYRSKIFNQAVEYNFTLLKDFYLSPFSHYKEYGKKFQLILIYRCLTRWKKKR